MLPLVRINKNTNIRIKIYTEALTDTADYAVLEDFTIIHAESLIYLNKFLQEDMCKELEDNLMRKYEEDISILGITNISFVMELPASALNILPQNNDELDIYEENLIPKLRRFNLTDEYF